MEDTERFNIDQLAAELNGHQVTDGDGQVAGENVEAPTDEVATPQEETQVEDTQKETEEVQDSNTEDLVEDESTGKKFVPIERFNKVYGKLKSLEREVSKKTTQSPALEEIFKPSVPVDKQDALETELLYSTMPEFDPNSDKYSKQLDILGGTIKGANPGITKLEAARRAKAMLKELANSQVTARQEVRKTKALQSEGNLAGRTLRESTKVDPNSMSLEEMESYLKENNLW